MSISSIEVSFAIPVELTDGQEVRLHDLVSEIARANTPVGHVHWLSEIGHKPNLSQTDARLLGKPVNPDAPERGSPTFDDSVLCFGTYCREAYPTELPASGHHEETGP